jgi:hypothetical protein
MNELDVLAYIGTPAPQVMVHPHRDDQEVLVCVEIHYEERVEARIAEYYVALRSSQSGVGTITVRIL